MGITYDIIKDTIIVKSVVAEGSSEKAGIFPGDKIVVIGGKTSVGVKTYEEVKQRLMGTKKSEVRLGVKRNKQPEILYFTIIRKKLNRNMLSYGINITDKDTPNAKPSIWANWYKNQQEFHFNFYLKNEKANQLFQKITNQIKSECNYYTVEGEAVYYSCPKSQYKGKTGFYVNENSGHIRSRTDL